ncbi:purine-cytosine permease-like protein [Neobacillus cucumis]|nr:purine-cytosine permease-like protein [Neobacillus cucumis]
MLNKKGKITSLFWIAILGLILTTIYTIILGILGYRTMNRIDYIYKQNKQKSKNG